jgi:glycosyltransferase involved in cell wall biosynthesis
MRTVLHLITGLAGGGAETLLVRLCRLLRDAGWRPAVACFKEEGEAADALREAGTEVTCLGCRSPLDARAVPRLLALGRRARPALLHTHLARADMVGAGVARVLGVPHVVTRHGRGEPGLEGAAAAAAYGEVLARAARVLAVSEAVAAFVRALTRGRGRVDVLAGGVPAAEGLLSRRDARAALALDDAAFVVGAAGRLEAVKGYAHLVAAVPAMAERAPGLTVVLIGDGPERAALEDRARDAGAAGRVRFAGWRPEAWRLLPACDVFVQPSLDEGLGIAALEAMAAGVPVVASGVGGLAEIVQDGRTGLAVSPGDPGALAGAVGRLAGDAALRETLAAAGREAAAAFDAGAWARRVAAVYDGLCC